IYSLVNILSIAKQERITVAKLLKYEGDRVVSPRAILSLNMAGDQYHSMLSKTFSLIRSFYLT
ncbi:hypothetical protein, partial [Enterobacter sp. 302C9]|uniref:hypothetical protein n=1 Tax=Enterobacter sp. 302C9 TaxID=3077766 RepID=UPI002A839112